MKKESRLSKAFNTFSKVLGLVLIRTGFRIVWMPKIRYESDKARELMKSDKPLIIISNHCYWFDPVMLYLVAHTSKMSVVAAKEVMVGVKGSLLKQLGCIPVDRTTMDLVCLRECAARVRQGERVGIFPEGMINFEEEMLPFKAGVTLISSQTGAPVVPVYISGDYRPFGRCQVLIGEGVDMSGYFSSPATAAEISKGTDALYDIMCSLKGKLLTSLTDKQRKGVEDFRAKFMVSRTSAIEEDKKETVNR